MSHISGAHQAGSRLLILFIWSIYSHHAIAGEVTLYRCVVGEAVEFRQTACLEGGETKIHVADHSRGITASKPAIRLKKVADKSDTKSSPKDKKNNRERCWKKRQQLDRVERKLRAGYKPSQYERLHERQAYYESYIREFCR